MGGVDFEGFRKLQRADGFASILAIGTANPPNAVDQSTYPDYYFRITGNEHNTELKDKFKRICKFQFLHSGGIQIQINTTTPDLPGVDFEVAKLLGLHPSVKRVGLFQHGCFAGGTVLRLVKDLAENNRGARVLVIYSKTTIVTFRRPSETHLDSLVGQALFSDGAAALVVGANPIPQVENPCFKIIWTTQTIVLDSDRAIGGKVKEVELTFQLKGAVPDLISTNIENCLMEAFNQFKISDWNQLFWVVHPRGRAILDRVEAKLNLDPTKLITTRDIMSEYGNMSSACVHFILDETRKASRDNECLTSGDGLEMGVLFGFELGLTIETVVLKSVPFNKNLTTKL
eukprot:PITA_30648